MNLSKNLLERRKKIVPQGVGMFTSATVNNAKNATIIDANGNELIDFSGGIGVLNAGHCQPEIVDAIIKQSQKLIHSCFHVATYEPYLDLCEKLAQLFPHGENTKVMLTNTGAEAVENAIKIARQYTKKQAVICFSDAFHGRSMMAMTLTAKVAYKLNCGPYASEVYRIPYPNYYKNGEGKTYQEYVQQEILNLNEVFVGIVNPNQVAAIIIEPVQGEGGFNVVPAKYFEALRKICTQNNIMLIADEVQSGFCRTGKWAAYQHFNVIPDISTWAKSMGSGLPIGAVVGRAEVMDGAAPGTIGGTYLGNPVSCAAAIATIKFMEQNDLNTKALNIAKIINEKFNYFKQKFDVIGDVRGLGAMLAFELVKPNTKEPNSELCIKLMEACLNNGLLLINAGTYKNCIRILSPLTISTEQLNKGLLIIEQELFNLTL